jgi:hypothetical protein
MIYMLKAGMTGDVRRGHGRRAVVSLLCLLSLVRGRCGLVVFVIIIAFACKIFRSFVFVGRSKILITA